MRYILIILVFLSVGAKAQMVIKAHANYRPFAQPAANLLLDNYPNAAAAYSLRKLDKDYTGAAIRVRKDTTGQPEQDIGFTASGDLDTAALKSFLNARSGFVTTWYNQADSAGVYGVRNITQATQSQQPRIALNGVINRQSNIVAVNFISANSTILRMSHSSLFQSGEFSFAAAIGSHTTNASQDFFGTRSGASGWSYIYRTNPQYSFSNIGEGQVDLFTTARTRHLLYFSRTTTPLGTNFIAINSTTTATATVLSLRIGTNFTVGFGGATGQGVVNGNIYEIIGYSSNQNSNRNGIESNINTYYSIY